MVRTPALSRQWNLLRVLSQHRDGLSIEEMAARTAVNSRTIRRDLRVFLDAGIPLRETIGRRNKKTWRVEPDKSPVLEGYSPEEYLALSLTERLFEPLRQTEYFDALSRCRSRAGRTMGKPARVRIEKIVEGFAAQGEEGFRALGMKLAETFHEATTPAPSVRFSAPDADLIEPHQVRANP
jgi:predicted DNA-binding transcriptional regulator YafY